MDGNLLEHDNYKTVRVKWRSLVHLFARNNV